MGWFRLFDVNLLLELAWAQSKRALVSDIDTQTGTFLVDWGVHPATGLYGGTAVG
jgi:hypothetical protein